MDMQVMKKKKNKEKRLIERLIFNLIDLDQFSCQNLATKTEIGKTVIFFKSWFKRLRIVHISVNI